MEFISNLWKKLSFVAKPDEPENDDIEDEESVAGIASLTARRFSCSGSISGPSRLSQRRHTLYDCNESTALDIVDDISEIIKDGINTCRKRSLSESRLTFISRQKRRQSLHEYYSFGNIRATEENRHNKGDHGRRKSVADHSSVNTSKFEQAREQLFEKFSFGGHKTKDTCERKEIFEGSKGSATRRSMSGGVSISMREEPKASDIVGDVTHMIQDGINAFRKRSLSESRLTYISRQKRRQSLHEYYSSGNTRAAKKSTGTILYPGRRRSVSESGNTSKFEQAREKFLEKITFGRHQTKDAVKRDVMIEEGKRSGRRRSMSGGVLITSCEETRKSLFTAPDQATRPDHRRRRHSFVGLGSLDDRKAFDETKDGVKGKLFRPEKRRSALISETVARKLAERKREMKTLTRQQTITYMKIKHDL